MVLGAYANVCVRRCAYARHPRFPHHPQDSIARMYAYVRVCVCMCGYVCVYVNLLRGTKHQFRIPK